MLWIGGALLGGVIGAQTAKKRGGNKADMAQYATGFGIALGLAGFILTIIIEKAL